MLPEDIQAELDSAYDQLALSAAEMEDAGHDKRAIIGGMGRLYAQLVLEEFKEREARAVLAQAITTLLMGESH